MALRTYTFSQLVSRAATAIQASASAVLNFSPGSALRAICEATAGVVLWLQAIVLQLLTLTRASTSSGPDLDSWTADYGLPRLPASHAAGQVTFARFTTGLQALIPVGAGVQTADGSARFLVTPDDSHPAYDAGLGGYVIPAGTASLSVPAQAVAPGSGGDVQAGSVSVLTTPVAGVDTVSNAADFTGGIDAESDAALRARFVLYLASLSKATETAVGYAVANVRQGLTYTITEGEDYDGAYRPGFFYVVVDDGTGYPADELIASVFGAVDAVRPIGGTFAVFEPIALEADVGMTITSAPGLSHPVVVGNVGEALADFLNALPLGTGLPYTQLAAVAYGVPGVRNASAILLNGGTADLAADQKTKVLAGTVTVA